MKNLYTKYLYHPLKINFEGGGTSQTYFISNIPLSCLLYVLLCHINHLKNILNQKTSEERREWLVEHIKGVGYKEVGHFHRNIGNAHFAILDRHLLTLLTEFEIINYTKTIKKAI